MSYKHYISIKIACSDFFKEYPYASEDEVTVTHLYKWSEDKMLKDVPDYNTHTFFGEADNGKRRY